MLLTLGVIPNDDQPPVTSIKRGKDPNQAVIVLGRNHPADAQYCILSSRLCRNIWHDNGVGNNKNSIVQFICLTYFTRLVRLRKQSRGPGIEQSPQPLLEPADVQLWRRSIRQEYTSMQTEAREHHKIVPPTSETQ
jgi:hypothetical protein